MCKYSGKERVANKLATLNLKKTVIGYWTAEETNIFKNHFDATFGTIALIVFPVVSLITTMLIKDTSWANYTFPLISICFAGAYDTYGRYEPKAAKNLKLAIRIILDGIASALACLFTGNEYSFCVVIPAILLLVCGIGICTEAFMRIQTAILISKWAIWKEEDEDNGI